MFNKKRKPWYKTTIGAFYCNFKLAREVYLNEKKTLPKHKRRKFKYIFDFYN